MQQIKRLEKMDNAMVRSMYGASINDRLQIIDLLETLGISSVGEVVRSGRLRLLLLL